MVHIISDTSTLYSSSEARDAGFTVAPLSVNIGGRTYREFDDIDSERFVDLIRQGDMPTSSQPSIGDVAERYDRFPGEEVIDIAMAHGLSATYDSAVAAKALCEDGDRITVVNTRTLCGPHRYLVERAVVWAKEGLSKAAILEKLNKLMDSAKSFLVPADFDYLRRGGRLSPLVSYVGQAVHLTPVMTQTDDGGRLTIAGIRRGFPHAFKFIAKALEKYGVGKGWKVYITHAAAKETAEKALAILKQALPEVSFEIHPLSPVFITQGGPGCVAVQCIRADIS